MPSGCILFAQRGTGALANIPSKYWRNSRSTPTHEAGTHRPEWETAIATALSNKLGERAAKREADAAKARAENEAFTAEYGRRRRMSRRAAATPRARAWDLLHAGHCDVGLWIVRVLGRGARGLWIVRARASDALDA